MLNKKETMRASQYKLTNTLAELAIPTLRLSYAWALAACIFTLSLGLRLACLNCNSLWFDELASVEVAQRGVQAIFTDRFGWMRVEPVLHYLIVWATIQPLDPTVSAVLVRLPSALAGSFTVLVVYGLGKELFGRVQGLIAASLLALSAVHLEYSQDVRPYAMLTFLTSLSIYCLLRAERTGNARWWAAFVGASALNLANAYVALTLLLPALAPYFLWLLWRYWTHRRDRPGQFRAVALAFVAICAAGFVMFIDMMQLPRAAPNWSQVFSSGFALSLVRVPVEMVAWFTQFSLDDNLQRVVQLGLLFLALTGAYLCVREGHGKGVFLCGLLIFIPAGLLAILGTTNVIYQRYALFAMPFYFLLIAGGLTPLASTWFFSKPTSIYRRRFACALLIGLLLTPSIITAYNRISSGYQTSFVIDHPDFRGISRFLTNEAKPTDTVVFAGLEPPAVADFYWKGRAPARVFSIVDPKLLAEPIRGDLYWVVSYKFNLSNAWPQGVPRWESMGNFFQATLLKENRPNSDMAMNMENFANMLEDSNPGSQEAEKVVQTLRGCIYQARGDAGAAARAYRLAGTYYPIGEEYLKTSEGFADRNDSNKAWRDALFSKSMEPQSPALHAWLAKELSGAGYQSLSSIEMEIARILK